MYYKDNKNPLAINSNLLSNMGVHLPGYFPSVGITEIFQINSVGDFIKKTQVKNIAHFLKQHLKSKTNPQGKIKKCSIKSGNIKLMKYFNKYINSKKFLNLKPEGKLPMENVQRIYNPCEINLDSTIIPEQFDKIFLRYSKNYINLENPEILKEITCDENSKCIECLKCYEPGETFIREMI